MLAGTLAMSHHLDDLAETGPRCRRESPGRFGGFCAARVWSFELETLGGDGRSDLRNRVTAGLLAMVSQQAVLTRSGLGLVWIRRQGQLKGRGLGVEGGGAPSERYRGRTIKISISER